MLSGVGDGATRHQLLQLGVGNGRTRERHGSNQHTKQNFEYHVRRGLLILDVHELSNGDQRRGTTTHTVEDGDKLRHGSHLNETGRRNGDDCSNNHAEHHQVDVRKALTFGVLVEERGTDGYRHTDGRNDVADTSSLRTTEALERYEEGRRGDEVQKVNQSGATH